MLKKLMKIYQNKINYIECLIGFNSTEISNSAIDQLIYKCNKALEKKNPIRKSIIYTQLENIKLYIN